MQVHHSEVIEDAELPVRLNSRAGDSPLCVITIGHLDVYVQSVTDADRLIRAAILAKDLIIRATGAQVREPASQPPAAAPSDGAE